VKLEPVGVFWDIENCPVPMDKSAFSLAAKMRRVFFEGKREAEFMCVCDVTKERKEVTNALHNAQVHMARNVGRVTTGHVQWFPRRSPK
jgi:meiosis arrest female protein 1